MVPNTPGAMAYAVLARDAFELLVRRFQDCSLSATSSAALGKYVRDPSQQRYVDLLDFLISKANSRPDDLTGVWGELPAKAVCYLQCQVGMDLLAPTAATYEKMKHRVQQAGVDSAQPESGARKRKGAAGGEAGKQRGRAKKVLAGLSEGQPRHEGGMAEVVQEQAQQQQQQQLQAQQQQQHAGAAAGPLGNAPAGMGMQFSSTDHATGVVHGGDVFRSSTQPGLLGHVGGGSSSLGAGTAGLAGADGIDGLDTASVAALMSEDVQVSA